MKTSVIHNVLTGFIFAAFIGSAHAQTKTVDVAAACPPLGWSENLINFLKPTAKIPTNNTPLGAVDCDFNEWSWESFVWATALVEGNVPRFMTLHTPSELLTSNSGVKKNGVRTLKLGARSITPHIKNNPEVAGAIVEADGNMLVSQNGYPVYASVHMNQAYFDTAKNNLIYTGDYTKNAAKDDYFPVGAAVFKATWLRLDNGQTAPLGTFTTQAEVPVLTVQNGNAVPVAGKFVTVTVALVGLHVVGTTINHPEFLWATFEHKLNSPEQPDNWFAPTAQSNPNNFTFYQANTPFSQVNIANQNLPATLTFNEATQKFSPVTNVVLVNKTGGENQPNGVQNIANLNKASQGFLANQSAAQAVFANYDLIGTVWMLPNTYVTTTPNWWNLNQTNAVGSVNLANATAETFLQVASNGNMANVQNCFLCHNATSFSSPIGSLASRRIGVSHVLGVNEPAPYSVPNIIPVISPSCGNVTAGPIWNNTDAKTKCPAVCKAQSKNWNGQWVTTTPGQQSVCGCCTQ
jgi:hypothetical protein